MPSNERKFRNTFLHKFGPASLGKKVRWPTDAKRNDVSITADASIVIGDKHILIEIDSGNAAKLLIGQYVLLSDFCESKRAKTLFLVVHYYKNYNAERTIKNFEHVAASVLKERALPFVVLGEKEFWEMCKNIGNLNALCRELTRRSTVTHFKRLVR